MKKEDRFPLLCLLIVAVAFVIGALNPVYPADWLMESWLVIIFVPLLTIFHITYGKFRFSNISYFLITLFFVLHIIGSHYTYSEAPIGFWISSLFNFSRNHYDRLVHFLWGFLLYIPTLDITKHFIPIKEKSKINFFYFLIPVFFLVSAGALFEVLEWLASIIVKPEVGLAYLGTQGDIWDTQKDIILKIVGSFIMSISVYLSNKK